MIVIYLLRDTSIHHNGDDSLIANLSEYSSSAVEKFDEWILCDEFIGKGFEVIPHHLGHNLNSSSCFFGTCWPQIQNLYP